MEDLSMKKKLIAITLAFMLSLSAVPSALALEGDTARCTNTLATLGLVQGNGHGYDLDTPATRAQAAVLLVRLSGNESLTKKQAVSFKDVPDWAAKSVSYATQQGWLKGITATTFAPNETITANAWFTMLLRMLGYSDASGDFSFDNAAVFARRIGLVSRDYTGTMTRGALFESIIDAISFRYKGFERTVLDVLLEKNAVPAHAVQALGLTQERLTARQIADRYMAAVFCISGYETREAYDTKKANAEASGFFISPDGLAVTNYHSIDGIPLATVTLITGEAYPIESVVYYDKEIDIAVLQISKTSLEQETTSAFACLEVVGTNSIRPGDVVYTLGNPLGLGLAISNGIISDIARDVEQYALPCVMNTADISQGSSGGALMNEFGQVIAVTSGAYIYGNNMYLAVPADPVLKADLTVKGPTLAEIAELEANK